jgi:hypothetical protein
MLELPTTRIEPKSNNPRFLIIFSKPKVGKSSFVASIDDNLIIDTEGSQEYLSSMNIQVRSVADLAAVVNLLSQKTKEIGKKPYKYITIDTGSGLEDIGKEYALSLYQQTPMATDRSGKVFTGDVLTLPNGAGYGYLRTAFEKLYSIFFDYCDHLIMLCHCKDKQINKDGQEISEFSLDLTGKIARIVSAKADAICYLYRSENKTIANFKSDGDYIIGARPEHLREKEIIVGESDDNLKVTWFPDRIYQ